MRQQGLPVALLVTLLFCCSVPPAATAAPAAAAAAADPLKRRIVPSLTDELKQQLKQYDVGTVTPLLLLSHQSRAIRHAFTPPLLYTQSRSCLHPMCLLHTRRHPASANR